MISTKDRIQQALKAERGMRLSAAEVQGLASALGLGFPTRKPRRRVPKPANRPPMTGNIRWMKADDLPEVLAMDAELRSNRWDEDEYRQHLRCRNVIGAVIECSIDGRKKKAIVGVMLYSLHKNQIVLKRLIIRRDFRLRTFGRQMIEYLRRKLNGQRRTHVRIDVRESDLKTQLFFQSVGFVAMRTEKKQIAMRLDWDSSTRPFADSSTPEPKNENR